jgi:hypothetical protein
MASFLMKASKNFPRKHKSALNPYVTSCAEPIGGADRMKTAVLLKGRADLWLIREAAPLKLYPSSTR